MAPTFDVTPEARATPGAFLKRQLFRSPPVIKQGDANLAGKTIIITGSNTGLGLECARQLLDLGLSRLILAVRNESKGAAARTDLATGRTTKQTIDVWKLDLDSYDSIAAFAQRASTLDRLDVLIHNAGLMKASFGRNAATGHEEVFQVNYLSMALLAILMLPVLRDKNKNPNTPGRLVLVSSDTAAWAPFKERHSTPMFPAFDDANTFVASERYWSSKLLGHMFLMELAKRVPSSVAVVNATNPGMCRGTGLSQDLSGASVVAAKVIGRVIGRSTALGARALTDAAVKHGRETHGQYMEDGKVQP